MFRVWTVAFFLLFEASALVCPDAYYGTFIDGGDESCYSESVVGLRNDAYARCAQEKSYLPIILNAFQNAGLQNKVKQGTVWDPLPGMWLGLTCTGNVKTSCNGNTHDEHFLQ